MKLNYQTTRKACFAAYAVQAAVNNIAPLLYLLIQREHGLTLAQIGFLMSNNFAVQICTDLFGIRYVDRLGYRTCTVAAHGCAFLGLLFLGLLPKAMPCFPALIIATMLYAAGGGMIEVVGSPLMEALPTGGKSASMSILHSFYCWGQMAVVLFTTGFLALFGEEYWFLIPPIWALLPLVNGILFLFVPICEMGENYERAPLWSLLKTRIYRLLLMLMLCAGICELAMSQWASAFAELGLNVEKSMGDLLGPCMFAVLMGLSRVIYAKLADRLNLCRYIGFSALLCAASYLVAVFSPISLLSLFGCALCGFSVGIMWPGTVSLAASHCPSGNASCFGALALAGDIGCTIGPAIVTVISGFNGGRSFLSLTGEGADLHVGLLAVVIVPFLMALCAVVLKRAVIPGSDKKRQ